MEKNNRCDMTYKDLVFRNLNILLGVIYFCFAAVFFHSVWYHICLALSSAIIFSVIFKEWENEREKDRFLNDTDKFLDILIHYYQHYDGHIVEALKNSAERTKGELGLIAELIIDEMQGVDLVSGKIRIETYLRNRLSTDSYWFHGLVEILFIIKEKGRNTKDEDDVYIISLEKMSELIKQEILKKMRNDNDNRTTEIWIMLTPLVAIAGTQLVYLVLFQNNFDILSTYKSIEAQTIASMTFIVGSLGALFVNWIRRG